MLPRPAAALVCLIVTCALPTSTHAADWPLWRHDANRSAASPQVLPARLHLQWVREYPPLKPAWPDQGKLQFDAAYEPIVLGHTLFVPSSRTDSLTAIDTRTGAEKWRFHAEGPIRFAPAAWDNRVYFTSDDGCLYCLDAAKGSLLWKFRGGPSDRKILGNERLISTWPARGAPVVHQGRVYFAASIWPFMGVFVHALDARSGAVIWTNDGDGSVYIQQPHHADSFAGVAPQGPMVVSGDTLLVPGGRSVPACFDLKTGKLQRYQLADNNQRGGGTQVVASGPFFFNGGAVFETATQRHLGSFADLLVLDGDHAYGYAKGTCRAYDVGECFKTHMATDRKGVEVQATEWHPHEVSSFQTENLTALIKAGDRLYAGAEGKLLAHDLPLQKEASWQTTIDGTPVSLLAADDRLFAVTIQGRICCFGANKIEPIVHPRTVAPAAPADAWTERARTLLETTGVRDGYCVVWGAGNGRLVCELAHQSNLRLIVVEPHATRVAALRQHLLAAELPSERVSVHQGEPMSFALPPYLASLMVVEDLQAANLLLNRDTLKKTFNALRPYGGVFCLPLPGGRQPELVRLTVEANLANARVASNAAGVVLVREGALPGAANWTHEHADAANTRVSKDSLVKAPLGILWFGGTSHEGVLPRHGHGPQPQVLDGRLFIEGPDMLRAIDIYTGRQLWETNLPGVGGFYDNTAHQPGANSSGTNYISMPDGIYVAYGTSCLRLDPVTGKQRDEFKLPAAPGAEPPLWGYLNVEGNLLVGGANPLCEKEGDDCNPSATKNQTPMQRLKAAGQEGLSSSQQLVVMDRHTGKVQWTATARSGFRHNAICIGGGRLYCIDRLSAPDLARLKRRGETAKHPARLVVLDLQNGKELWSTETEVFGTWLSFSAKHDVLVEAGRVARDSLSDEPRGMRAYKADSGKVLWHHGKYAGPAMLHGDTVLKDQSACDLLTGVVKMRPHPLTGADVPWSWVRNHGCNTPMASEHLLTFRSGAAGYFDLCNDGGTGNFGGFRSSCTNNLVVAGGVLTAPDYTRTCTCSYQNQTSLALVPLADAEMWTSFGPLEVKGPVQRLGINLGAPGDRRADDGTLWLEYPSVGGQSPAVPINLECAAMQWFRHHASQIDGAGLPWVSASGVKGVTALTVDLGETKVPRTYTVRLHFVEPDSLKPGQRRFAVALQGREVLTDFDIVREAGAANRALVKEFKGIAVTSELALTFHPASGAEIGTAVLCGVEVIAEERK